jgi:hypothetical protein
MNELIERVARAIQAITHPDDPYDMIIEEGQEQHKRVARAAITAMREPTRAMVATGDDTPTTHSWGNDGEFACCEPIWRAMISAALAE